MANTLEARLAAVERHCELLAIMCGKSCEELDVVWRDYQTAKTRGGPLPPALRGGN